MAKHDLPRKLVAEALGTAGLLAAVVGSGIMGERLAGGNEAIALLANTIATGAALAVLILSFGGISGAHLNPAVSITEAYRGALSWRECGFYIPAQIVGGLSGTAAANVMFDLPVLFVASKARSGAPVYFAEIVATFGLIGVIRAGMKFRPRQVAYMVGGYITAAYWFTSSTSFANPAVTIARVASDTFTGIAPANVPYFLAAQILGAFMAALVFSWLLNPSGVGNEDEE